LEGFLAMPMGDLREALLSVRGVGPETADSIILYAARKPAFVVDAYTRRILDRLGVDAGRRYEDVAAWFVEGIPVDVDVYGNYHAVLVETAKGFCRKRPLCGGCPLAGVCRTCGGASIY
jgi:endonuclease-3 related protein